MKKQLLMTVIALAIASSHAFAGPKVKQNCPQCQLPSASFSLSVESPCANGKCPAPVQATGPITSGPVTAPIIAPTTGDIITESQTEPGGVYWRLPDGRLSKTNPWGKVTVPATATPMPAKRGGLSLNLDITGPFGGQLHLSASVGRLLQLHNSERARVGAPPLIEDSTLTAYALAHSQKQANSGRETCFHSNPIVYAENVAYTSEKGQDADQAHRQWMNSSGHRAQLLSGKYTRVGFAAVTGPKGTYFTEVFQ